MGGCLALVFVLVFCPPFQAVVWAEDLHIDVDAVGGHASEAPMSDGFSADLFTVEADGVSDTLIEREAAEREALESGLFGTIDTGEAASAKAGLLDDGEGLFLEPVAHDSTGAGSGVVQTGWWVWLVVFGACGVVGFLLALGWASRQRTGVSSVR
jgi:hypothetical protein